MGKVFIIKGHKVMLDIDLAELYGDCVKYVRFISTLNKERFPDDFKFSLTAQEKVFIKSQSDRLEKLTLRDAYTEVGALALASQLRSDRAININIQYIKDLFDSKTISLFGSNSLFFK